MNARALLVLGTILLSACRTVTSTPVPTLTATPTISTIPIVWIPEMQAFDQDFSSKASPTNAEIDSFQAQWQAGRNLIASQVSVDKLVGISRWAQEQTKTTVLPTDWMTSVPMNPIGATKDGTRVLFGQETEQGIPLPVHAPLVFRRLIVDAVYDRDANSISKVYITIRGWREE